MLVSCFRCNSQNRKCSLLFLAMSISTGICNNLENHFSYMLCHRDCKYTNKSKKLEWITIFGCRWLKGSGRSNMLWSFHTHSAAYPSYGTLLECKLKVF